MKVYLHVWVHLLLCGALCCQDSRASSGPPGFSQADWWPHHPTLPTAPTAPSKTPAALHRICDALIRATETNASFSFCPFYCLPLSLGFFYPLLSWLFLY